MPNPHPTESERGLPELLPCPFCGERTNLHVYPYDDEAYVQCHQCTTTGPSGGDEEIAKQEWNGRAAISINYSPLHEFAMQHRVSYNELCTAVRDATNAIEKDRAERSEAVPVRPQETDRDWAAAQDWKNMDGATAFLLINRHADGWGDTRAMMEAWLEANRTAPPERSDVQGAESVVLPKMPDLRFHGEYRRGYADCLGDVYKLNPPASRHAVQQEGLVSRANVLEEAARLCEWRAHAIDSGGKAYLRSNDALDCARAIRAIAAAPGERNG